MDSYLKLESAQREKLIRQRSVAKGMLSRMQTFIESGNSDVDDIQVRCNKLPSILAKYEAAQEELECYDDSDHSEDRALFEQQYCTVEARLNKLLRSSHGISNSPDNVSEHGSHAGSNHSGGTYIKLPTIQIPSFDGDYCSWLNFKDTFESLIAQNTTLSNIQRFHYLITALKGEPKQLIANLAITSDNFDVAWKLVTERYNNKKLIAMQHINHLMHVPQAKRGDLQSLRQLINHITSHVNALEAMALSTSIHTLMLNHLALSGLDTDTHRAWELHASSHQELPSTAQVITFLEQRCKALELLNTSQQSSTPVTAGKPTSSPRFKVSSSA